MENEGKKMKIIVLIISITISLFLAFIYIINYPGHMFVDYPCNIIINEGYLDEWSHPRLVNQNLKDAEIFISRYFPHSSGGGCMHKPLSIGEPIILDNNTINLLGDKITIDKNKGFLEGEIKDRGLNTLNIGEVWNDKSYEFKISNPWWIYIRNIRLKNEGFVNGYRLDNGTLLDFDKEVLLITGFNNEREMLNPLILVIFLASIIIPFLIIFSSIRHFIKKKF